MEFKVNPDRAIKSRARSRQFDKMLGEAFEDRQPRETVVDSPAEAETLRDTLRKAANTLGIGLDFLVTEEDGKWILAFAARPRRQRKDRSDKGVSKQESASALDAAADDDDDDDYDDDNGKASNEVPNDGQVAGAVADPFNQPAGDQSATAGKGRKRIVGSSSR